jgi:competence protein ComEC
MFRLLHNFFIKYPAAYSTIALIIGITLSFYFPVSILGTSNNILFISIQVILFILSIFTYIRIKSNYTYLIFFTISVLLFGFIRFQKSYHVRSTNSVIYYLDKINEHELVECKGLIIEEPDLNENKYSILLSADSLIIRDLAYSATGNITVLVYKERFKNQSNINLKAGNYVKIKGYLKELPRKRNPGEFDYGLYLKLHGIDASFYSFGFENIQVLFDSESNFYKKFIIAFKKYTMSVVDDFVGGNEGEFLKALLVGDRANFPRQMRDDFINAGVAHIIAVSGLNVAFVMIIISTIISFFPVNQKLKTLLLVIGLIFYMNLTGNTPSIVRATLMALCYLSARHFERKPNNLNIIFFSAFLILLFDTRQLFDSGFILSYSAVLSLILLYPLFKNAVRKIPAYIKLQEKNIYRRILKNTIDVFIVTLTAQIGILPITIIMFNKISLVSLYTNILAIPLSNVALAIGFGVVIFSFFSHWLTLIIAVSVKFLLYFIVWFINWSASLKFAYFEIYNTGLLFLIVYYIVLAYIILAKRFTIKFRFISSGLVIALFILGMNFSQDSKKLFIHYLDFGGQGSVLIHTPENKNVMINVGESKNNFSTVTNNIRPYLNSQNVNSIDLIILTSLDKNKFSNLLQLIQVYPVKRIVYPSMYKPLFDNPEWKNNFKRIELIICDSNLIIKDINNTRFYVTASDIYGKTLDASLFYGEKSFYFLQYSKSQISKSRVLNETHNYPEIALLYDYQNMSDDEWKNIITSNPKTIILPSLPKKKFIYEDEILEKSLTSFGYNVINIGKTGAEIYKTNGHNLERVDWK